MLDLFRAGEQANMLPRLHEATFPETRLRGQFDQKRLTWSLAEFMKLLLFTIRG
jgi:hypothetical protein